MNPKMIRQYALMLAATAMAAFFQTFLLKADIGVCATWDSVGMNIYEVFGIKVGTVSMALSLIGVFVQFLILREKFSFRRILQIPISIFYGMVMNVCYYDVLTFTVHAYWMRVLLCLVSIAGMAVFLGITTALDLVPTPAEAMCYVVSERYEIPFGRIRLGLDLICVGTSLLLSLVFHVSVKVREGTLAGAFLLGPLMGWCMRRERRILKRMLR